MKTNLRSILARFKASTKPAPTSQQQVRSRILYAVLVAGCFAPRLALAGPWDGVGDAVLQIFTGGLGRSLATVGVIACGIMALFGRLSWQWAGNIIIGIVLIFGGAAIVDYFSASVG